MEDEVVIKQNRRRSIPAVTPEDFWRRIVKPDGCWLYDGCKEINGYGYLQNPLGDTPKFITAHRLAWILTFGPVPEGMHVMHKCDVRACVNPEHLRLGTHQENMDDKTAKRRNISILTPEDVREIRAAYAALGNVKKVPNGFNEALGKKYGVGGKTVWEVRRGINWSHIK